MNGRERRRAAKLGDIVEIKFGRVVFHIKPGEDTSRDVCFVCGKPATAWLWPQLDCMAHGFAYINGKFVLLCEDCFNTEEKTYGAIARKYWNAPNIEISKGRHIRGHRRDSRDRRRDQRARRQADKLTPPSASLEGRHKAAEESERDIITRLVGKVAGMRLRSRRWRG